MKTILYARVSTDDQTVEPQLIELRAEAARRGMEIVAEVTDVASGGRRDRVGLERMMEIVRRREVDCIMAVRLDRLARSLSHFAALSEELASLKVGLILSAQGVDTTGQNPCGELLQGLLAVIAQFERSLIRERTRAGLVAARARGAVIGRHSIRMKGLDRSAICSAWRADGQPGGYIELGRRLGGVNPGTAWRVNQTR